MATKLHTIAEGRRKGVSFYFVGKKNHEIMTLVDYAMEEVTEEVMLLNGKTMMMETSILLYIIKDSKGNYKVLNEREYSEKQIEVLS